MLFGNLTIGPPLPTSSSCRLFCSVHFYLPRSSKAFGLFRACTFASGITSIAANFSLSPSVFNTPPQQWTKCCRHVNVVQRQRERERQRTYLLVQRRGISPSSRGCMLCAKSALFLRYTGFPFYCSRWEFCVFRGGTKKLFKMQTIMKDCCYWRVIFVGY